MTGYFSVLLDEIIMELGESRVKSMLSLFSCPQNQDIEFFLTKKAIEFSKQSLAKTHLVFTSYKENPVLIGYFSLSNKYIVVKKEALSHTLQKKISKFSTFDAEAKQYVLSAPLIAQFSKNFYNGYNNLISGDELLQIAISKIKTIQHEIGGKVIYLECEDNDFLKRFYRKNGFIDFNTRCKDSDETAKGLGKYYIQMLKYL